MTKRGYFIINGIPRVIINQISRSPGIYFRQTVIKNLKYNKTQISRKPYVDLISQRGAWLRLEIDKKKKIWVKMKKAPRIPIILLFKSFGFDKKFIFQNITKSEFNFIGKDYNDFNSIIFQELLKPISGENDLFIEVNRGSVWKKFLNPRSYYLGKWGRHQLNKKLGLSISNDKLTLTPEDLLYSLESLIQLSKNKKNLDNIDHLENRRIKTSGELIQNQFNQGLIRLEKNLTEKLKKSKNEVKIKNLFNVRSINSTIREFFLSSQLSQFLDQTNPLAELTHKRRLTSIGPGGINRETAGMTIRSIHPTHYTRICPIETPEGQNAGLVNSMTVFASINEENFIESPFFKIYKGQIQKRIGVYYLKADSTTSKAINLNGLSNSNLNFLPLASFTTSVGDNFLKFYRDSVNYNVVSCFQLISIATSLIPFLEHDDANRALMGSNMQRQAIPLLKPERAIIGTGLESKVLFNSGNFLQLNISGLVYYVSNKKILVHNLFNFKNLVDKIKIEYKNQLLTKNCKKSFINPLFKNQKFNFLKNCVSLSSLKTVKGSPFIQKRFIEHILQSKLSLYLFKKDYFEPYCYKADFIFLLFDKSFIKKEKYFKFKPFFIHKNLYRLKKINRQKLKGFRSKKYLNFVYKFPVNINKSKYLLQSYLRSNQGTSFLQVPFTGFKKWQEKGDLLTNNLSSCKGELAIGQNLLVGYLPWEGFNFEDAVLINEELVYSDRYTSLHIEKYEAETHETPFGTEEITRQIPEHTDKSLSKLNAKGVIINGSWVEEGDILVGKVSPIRKRTLFPHEKLLYDIVGKNIALIKDTSLRVSKGICGRVIDVKVWEKKIFFQNKVNFEIHKISVYILQKKKIQVGDKIAGRHGNKGIISKTLLPIDMPYCPDGKPFDMILNPLGVPSRMNVGQIFEALLGFAGVQLHQQFKIQSFDEVKGQEASRSFVFSKLLEAKVKTKQSWIFSPNNPGKFHIFDGRTGSKFHFTITAGYSYILKLIHLVDEKIHARSTGSYSLVTQQPLRGRSKHGGQRFGEMEVWALEGFGAAYILQELLTVKSDDIKGRAQIMEKILKNSSFQLGTPESFKVLIRELQALCLNVQINYQDI